MKLFTAIIVALLITEGLADPPAAFYVSTDGSDNNDGSIDTPWQTLGKAQIEVQALNPLPAGGIVVFLKGNFQTASLPLGQQDSGTPEAPVYWSGWPGEEAMLSGGVPVTFSKITGPTPVPLPSGVMVCNVSAFGVGTNYGDVANQDNMLELFYGGEPMQLARYPNTGFLNVADVPSTNNGQQFGYNDSHVGKWAGVADVWLHGYWNSDYEDYHAHVTSIDAANQQVHLDPSTTSVFGSILVGERYYALNILAELDAPGEYYLDRTTGLLYFYPPDDGTSDAWVSLATSIFYCHNASYIQIQNLAIMHARVTNMEFHEGTNLTIQNCTIGNNGQAAISIQGTVNVNIVGNTIKNSGATGVWLSSGDQATLTPGNANISYNNFFGFSRWNRCYNPGLSYFGVDGYIGYNNFSDAPHSAIIGGGNNWLVEYNWINNVTWETSDSGAFYTGRSWAQRGNVLQYNTFTNIHENMPAITGGYVHAAYFDDQMSGWTIAHNLFVNVTRGVFLGGGRDNIVFNNTFLNVSEFDVPIDNRGMGWQSYACATNGMFEQELESFHYQSPPWSTAYPYLVNIMNEKPCVPVNNRVFNNTYCGGSTQFTDQNEVFIDEWDSSYTDNTGCGAKVHTNPK